MATRGVVAITPGCGGAERVAYQLARYLARGGHEVTLVSDFEGPLDSGSERLTLVPINNRLYRLVLRLESGFARWILQHLIGNIAVAWRVRRLLRQQSFDVIHTHGSLSTVLIARGSSVPVVYTEHDATPWQCRYRRWWERLARRAIYRTVNVAAFRHADQVAATFPALREEIIRRWGIPEHKVCAAPNSADTEIFGPAANRRHHGSADENTPRVRDRRRYSFDRYCLYVGRLTPRKAPDLLLRALASSEDVCCLFVGDGPMRPQLERLARSLGLAQRVSFLGNVEPMNLARIYAEADLLVLPSVSEASPLVVLEAMAMGTPVLASRIAGLPALVQDWENGFLVAPGDVGALAVALRFLMRDEELRRRMGANAERKAMELSVWPNAIGGYLEAYSRVLPAGMGVEAAAPEPADAAELVAEAELADEARVELAEGLVA